MNMFFTLFLGIMLGMGLNVLLILTGLPDMLGVWSVPLAFLNGVFGMMLALWITE